MLLQLLLTLVTLSAAPTLDDVPELAQAAIAGDASAVVRLRSLGPPGLDALVKLRRELSSVPALFVGPATPKVKAWEALVDQVARQKYASASGLYWYTDLAQAKAEARRLDRPILSLRLLGDLGEDLSCANSRFFRTILYPDPAIAAALHDGWVLHWESVHDVPKIEIDFGDGRKLVRTITGNSLHYALTPDGAVVEVMPGMVGPAAFSEWLAGAGDFARKLDTMPAAERPAALAAHFRADIKTRTQAWRAALRSLGLRAPRTFEALAETSDDVDAIEGLAALRPVTLSPQARALIGPMMPTDTRPGELSRLAMPIAIMKARIEMPMLTQLGPVEDSLAQDEIKNLFEMKIRLAMLALESDLVSPEGVAALTGRIYAEAFLTPLDDPWMGLAPADVFTALPPEVERVGAARR